MPLPRVPKIPRSPVADEDGPDWTVTLALPDPFGLGPTDPWLKVEPMPMPAPSRLRRRQGDLWHDEGPGVWRIHAWRSPSTAIVSQDQVRLLDIDEDGTRRVLWEGGKLLERWGGGIWGDNWMFAAAVLGDGRWLAIVPLDEPSLDPERGGRRLVLFDGSGNELGALELPERTPSAVARGACRRFMARQIHVAASGRVAMLSDVDVLAVGIYDDGIRFIGKSTMPTEGGLWTDGTDILVCSSTVNRNYHWSRYEGLEDLWAKKRG